MKEALLMCAPARFMQLAFGHPSRVALSCMLVQPGHLGELLSCPPGLSICFGAVRLRLCSFGQLF